MRSQGLALARPSPVQHSTPAGKQQPLKIEAHGEPVVEYRFGNIPLQRKLEVGSTDDPLEREADAVAERVMRMPDPSPATTVLQRKCACGGLSGGNGQCSECAKKEEVQRSAARPAATPEAPPIIHDVLSQPGTPLDLNTRAFFESRFGQDFSNVRLHASGVAAQSARAVQALAYTVGDHIVLCAGHSPGASGSQRLLAHELTHVVQQRSGTAPPVLARTHDPNHPGSSRAVSLPELHDILVKLLKSLKRRTQFSVVGFKTIAVGLVEATDENGAVFQTLVYTTSGNWGSTDLETQAAALGIQRLTVNPRTEGRGDTGAPSDSEQLLFEATDENDLNLLGFAVTRKPCPDCSEAIADEDVGFVFVDPAKHLPKRQRVRTKKPSANLEAARSEIAQAFMPQTFAPGQEATTGLSPESNLWQALDALDMPELYQALEEADRAGRMWAIERKTQLAIGVNTNRLFAAMVAIVLKKGADPYNIFSTTFTELLAQIQYREAFFLLNEVYPYIKPDLAMLSAVVSRAPKPAPPKTTGQTKSTEQATRPKEKSPSENAAESTSYVGTMIKVLVAAGVTAAAIDSLADTLVLIAGKIVRDIVWRIVAEGAVKETVRETVKRIAEEELKVRITSDAVRHRVAEKMGEEVEPLIEELTKSYLRN